MKEQPLSLVRKGLIWWFRKPANPYVTLTGVVDFEPAEAYLQRLNAAGGPPVSRHHLLVGAVARVLQEFPEANARVIGGRIFREPHVGVLMPVNLLGHRTGGGAGPEVGLILVKHAETLTLRQIAATSRQAVAAERAGRISNAFIGIAERLIERLPTPLLSPLLDLADGLHDVPWLAPELYRRLLPFTTALTNAGAPLGQVPDGLLFRGVAMDIPQRLVHIPTVWGISALQSEVLAVAGQPAVRRVLPFALIFDHRLFDGIKAGRLLLRFGEILTDPAAILGPTGEAPGPARAAASPPTKQPPGAGRAEGGA